jgi:hypothetical protein
MKRMTIVFAAAALLAAPAFAQHGPPAGGDRTVNLQGDPGPFADKDTLMPFYQVLLDAHKQGDKADLEVVEEKIRTLIPKFTGGTKPSKSMEDHILGVAHQALAMGVGNPKMFDSYETFLAAMMGPQ